MAGRSSYHRMRPGEHCDECPTRHWYEQEGLRFCRNGHQLEGFAAHEAGEDEYNSTGRVTKRKKEKRKREGLKLEGAKGRTLYLQSLQYVLRKMVEWIRGPGLRLDVSEIGEGKGDEGTIYEELVKELWGLVCALPSVMEDEEGEHTEGSATDDMMASSSEPENSDAESIKTNAWLERSRGNKLPSLIDTLALCYLACVILKQPVTTADFHGWAQMGEIEFLAAIHSIPQNVKDRLPAKYHRALQVRDHIKPGKLLYTAQELAVVLNVHYELKLPALNYPQILLQYILDLTLPVEVYLMAKCLIQILGVKFEYPDGANRRIRAMDNPEVLLIILVVVATKLLHPLDGVERPPESEDDPRAKQINWAEWEKVRAETKKMQSAAAGLEKGTEHQITANDALLMDEKQTDDYMDWFEKMWIGNEGEAKTPALIRREFQSEPIRSKPPHQAETNNQSSREETATIIHQRYQVLNATMRQVELPVDPQPQSVANRIRKRPDRDFCPIWRTEDELPPTARVFYQEAADLAAIPLKTVILAASQVERRIEVWSADREREKRLAAQPVTEDRKGKGKAVA